MTWWSTLVAAVVTAVLGGGAAVGATEPHGAPEQTPPAALAGRVGGDPVECIERLDIDMVEVVAGAIVYTMKHGRVAYLNVPGGGANFLHPGTILLVDPAYPQLCRGEVLRTVDDVIRRPFAAVTLGTFTPYRKP